MEHLIGLLRNGALYTLASTSETVLHIVSHQNGPSGTRHTVTQQLVVHKFGSDNMYLVFFQKLFIMQFFCNKIGKKNEYVI
jgi:hypothetical protein